MRTCQRSCSSNERQAWLVMLVDLGLHLERASLCPSQNPHSTGGVLRKPFKTHIYLLVPATIFLLLMLSLCSLDSESLKKLRRRKTQVNPWAYKPHLMEVDFSHDSR